MRDSVLVREAPALLVTSRTEIFLEIFLRDFFPKERGEPEDVLIRPRILSHAFNVSDKTGSSKSAEWQSWLKRAEVI